MKTRYTLTFLGGITALQPGVGVLAELTLDVEVFVCAVLVLVAGIFVVLIVFEVIVVAVLTVTVLAVLVLLDTVGAVEQGSLYLST